MEFLDFLVQRLHLSPDEASRKLGEALLNYQPSRDYSRRTRELETQRARED